MIEVVKTKIMIFNKLHYYKEWYTPKQTSNLYFKLQEKYDNKVYIFLDSKTIPLDRSKTKLLSPKDTSCGCILYEIRRSLGIGERETIYLITEKGYLLNLAESMGSIQAKYKNKNGFLYLFVEKEHFFG